MKNKILKTLSQLILLICVPFLVFAQWTNISGTGYTGEIQSICILDSILLIGTSDGIYRSMDYGVTLENVCNKGVAWSIVTSGDTVFTLIGNYFYGFLYSSTDGGVNWIQCVPDTIVAPRNLAVSNENVFVPIGGASGNLIRRYSRVDWKGTDIESDLPNIVGCRAFIVQGNTFFVSLEFNEWTVLVYRSMDKGSHWESCVSGLPEKRIDKLVSGKEITAAVTYDGSVYITTNNGTLWKELKPASTIPTCVAIGPSNEIFIGTKNDGVFSTTDLGNTWEQKNNGLTVGYICEIVTNGSTAIARTPGNSILHSKNNGDAWNISSCYIGGIIDGFLLYQNNALFAGNHYYGLFRSNDFGKNWEPAMYGLAGYSYPPYGHVSINDVVSDTIGLIAQVFSEDEVKNGSYISPIYRSSDNGIQWNKISLGGPSGPSYVLHSLNNILFSAGGRKIYRSSDHGESWSVVGEQIIKAEINGMSNASGFLFASSTYYGKIYRSSDIGLTWIETPTPEYTYIKKIVGNNNYMFAATGNNVWRSSDDGITWNPASNGSPGRKISDLIVKGDTLLSATESGIGISTDLGGHWYKLENNFPENAQIIKLTLAGEYLIAGLSVPNSTIPNSVWRLPLTQIVASVKSVGDKALTPTFTLSQNYPNPFNPSTTIRYSIPKNGHVSLAVYDVLGRKVAELVNEAQEPGEKQVEFNATNLSNGLYFYRLESDVYTQTKKMALIK